MGREFLNADGGQRGHGYDDVSSDIQFVWHQSARPRIPYMKAFHVIISGKGFFESLIRIFSNFFDLYFLG